jgi:hypothetical protein
MSRSVLTAAPATWRFVREVGVERSSDGAHVDCPLYHPIAVHYAGPHRDLVIVDRCGEEGRVFRQRAARFEQMRITGMRCSSLMIKSLERAGDGGWVIVSGNWPREVAILDESAECRAVVWSSDRREKLNWPSYAVPFGGHILIGDQATEAPIARAAGLCLMSREGDLLWEWRPGRRESGLGEPSHLAVLDDETIVVTDAECHQVFCLDSRRHLCWTYGEFYRPGSEPGRLSGPAATTVTSRGTLLVTDARNHRLVELSREGRLVRMIGGERDAGGTSCSAFHFPMMALEAPDGSITVADTENGRVVRLQGGAVETIAGRRHPDRHVLSLPRSVQTLEVNRWLVADTNNNRVVELDASGEIHWQYGNGVPVSTAALRWPRCAWRARNGWVLIADGANGRVLAVDRSGGVRMEMRDIALNTDVVALGDPHMVRELSDDALLVVDSGSAFVAEVDWKGRARWSSLSAPAAAELLRDPHQAVAMSDGTLRIADASAGLITCARATGITAVASELRSREGTVLGIAQPKALIEASWGWAVATNFSHRNPLVCVGRDGYAVAVPRLDTCESAADDDRYAFHNPRWLETNVGSALIVSDTEAHRLVWIEPAAVTR